jgi:hypothetical protein
LIDRKQANKLLLSEGLQHGAFLIRESSTHLGTFALAVRDEEEVRHYRIDEEKGLFSINGSANKYASPPPSPTCCLQHHDVRVSIKF